MAYQYQTFTAGQVHTAAQAQQTEDNIRDHVHGQDGVSETAIATMAKDSITRSYGGSGEWPIASYEVPADRLSAGKSIRVVAQMQVNSVGAAGYIAVRFKYGATTLATLIASEGAAAAAHLPYYYTLEAIISSVNSSTSEQTGILRLKPDSSFAHGSHLSQGGVSAEDASGALGLSITQQGDAGQRYTVRNWFMEHLS